MKNLIRLIVLIVLIFLACLTISVATNFLIYKGSYVRALLGSFSMLFFLIGVIFYFCTFNKLRITKSIHKGEISIKEIRYLKFGKVINKTSMSGNLKVDIARRVVYIVPGLKFKGWTVRIGEKEQEHFVEVPFFFNRDAVRFEKKFTNFMNHEKLKLKFINFDEFSLTISFFIFFISAIFTMLLIILLYFIR